MKRSAAPERRTELRRTRWDRVPHRFPAITKRQRTKRRQAYPVRMQVFERDGWRCVVAADDSGRPKVADLPPCFPHPRQVEFGHLRKDGQGGPVSLANGTAICPGHNGWVDDNPGRAHELGLVAWAGDHPVDVWRRLLLAGLVSYSWDGTAALP